MASVALTLLVICSILLCISAEKPSTPPDGQAYFGVESYNNEQADLRYLEAVRLVFLNNGTFFNCESISFEGNRAQICRSSYLLWPRKMEQPYPP